MKDRDWIYTGDGNNPAYNNTIAHLRKSDSVSTWTYDKLTGEIDYNGTPFGPLSVIHRVDDTGGN